MFRQFFPTLFLGATASIIFWLSHKTKREMNLQYPTSAKNVFLLFTVVLIGVLTAFQLLKQNVVYVFITANIIVISAYIFQLETPLSRFADFASKITVTVGISCLWTLLPTWWLYNVTASLLAIAALSIIPVPRMEYTGGILSGLVAYDIVGVYLSNGITIVASGGGSGIIPPIALITPPIFSTEATSLTVLGIGDILWPGLAIMAAYKLEIANWAISGYLIGLGISLVVYQTFGLPVPALVFIAPTVLTGIIIGKHIKKPRS